MATISIGQNKSDIKMELRMTFMRLGVILAWFHLLNFFAIWIQTHSDSPNDTINEDRCIPPNEISWYL